MGNVAHNESRIFFSAKYSHDIPVSTLEKEKEGGGLMKSKLQIFPQKILVKSISPPKNGGKQQGVGIIVHGVDFPINLFFFWPTACPPTHMLLPWITKKEEALSIQHAIGGGGFFVIFIRFFGWKFTASPIHPQK